MSYLPFSEILEYSRPTHLRDQHFGLMLEPEDFARPLVQPQPHRHHISRGLLGGWPHLHHGYNRHWRSASADKDAGSVVSVDKDRFHANLDVQQFTPDEITVKVTGDDTVTIEGRHEEKQDDHGYISRHFVRKYVLPKGHDIGKIESKLSSDGVLTISAPKLAAVDDGAAHRHIPIVHTGQPIKGVVMGAKDEGKK